MGGWMSSGAGRGGGASQPSYLGMPKAAPLEGMQGRPPPRKRIQMTFHPSARNHTQICSEGGARRYSQPAAPELWFPDLSSGSRASNRSAALLEQAPKGVNSDSDGEPIDEES